jgi:hypothetical protein
VPRGSSRAPSAAQHNRTRCDSQRMLAPPDMGAGAKPMAESPIKKLQREGAELRERLDRFRKLLNSVSELRTLDLTGLGSHLAPGQFDVTGRNRPTPARGGGALPKPGAGKHRCASRPRAPGSRNRARGSSQRPRSDLRHPKSRARSLSSRSVGTACDTALTLDRTQTSSGDIRRSGSSS